VELWSLPGYGWNGDWVKIKDDDYCKKKDKRKIKVKFDGDKIKLDFHQVVIVPEKEHYKKKEQV
jgi:hypothetical protein